MSDVLAVEGVQAGYFPDVPILNGVALTVAPGEMVTIVGPNGAGKSTLVRVVIGLLKPWTGSVVLRGEDVTGRKPHAIVGRGVGYVAQRDNVFATMSVEENLELGTLANRGTDPGERLAEMLSLFPRLDERRRQPAGTLSGGERQMLALARALMAAPEVLLLDEPSAGLSPLAVDTIFEKIGEINASGIAILMVEQNARRALAMSHRGYVLDGGRNRYDGSGPELLHDPNVVELYLGGAGASVDGGAGSAVEDEQRAPDAGLEP
jgi:ABC-type branched-subunit amino acid transport system ATPase component